MSIRKIVLILAVFICFLTGLRLVWLSSTGTPNHPEAYQGVLDLSDWDFQHNRTITLNGEWEYYPDQLITPESLIGLPPTWLNVPGAADSSYGSYRLTVLTPPHAEASFGIIVPGIQAASQFIINGEMVASYGIPAEQKEDFVARNKSYTIHFIAAEDGVNELILHAANYYSSPEIMKSLKFGTAAAIDSEWMGAVGTQLVMVLVFLLHGLYALIIYSFNRNSSLIYFVLLVFCIAISIASSDDKLLLIWFPSLSYEWEMKIRYISYVLNSVFLLKLMEVLFYRANLLFRIIYSAAGAYCLFVLASSNVQLIHNIRPVFSLLVLVPVVIIPLVLFKILSNSDNKDNIYILLAGVSVFSSLFWGRASTISWTDTISPYPFDMIIALICFATYWFKQYFRHTQQTKILADMLLQESVKKDEFLAHASHELRTPLHGMINIAHSVLSDVPEELSAKSNIQQNLHLLIRIGRRMSSMLNDLLDLTQIRENKIRLKQSPIRVQSIAAGVTDILSYIIEDRPVQMKMNIPSNFPLVSADENRLTQVLFNLLHNATKFTKQGTIEIEALCVGNNKAEFVIRDTGIGIDEETLKTIFKPYEQGKSVNASGVGLGLSISKQLLELHGSTLEADSVLGEGTVFRFKLPLADVSEVAQYEHREPVRVDRSLEYTRLNTSELSASLAPSAATRKEQPHVLVIDDDSVNLKIIGEILTKHQFSVTLELKGERLLSKLAEMNVDVLILDVMMPDVSGYELTRQIRSRYSLSELPILLLTARSQPDDIYTGFQAGANDYVTKPVDAIELIYRVKSLTDLKQSIRDQGRMEAAYLQAQIEPHFLFNTLNSISALGEIDMKRMHDMIEAFSNYLRISFDYWNAEPLVTLEHELKLVRSYLYIEEQRFMDRLRIIWHVSADTCNQIPPLTLQPIVENAVKHGILQNSQAGTIQIEIIEQANEITFTVKDNGKGMSAAKLARLFSEEPSGSIGLRNTDRRLKQRYGKGLNVQSKPGEGTIVTFTIPISR